MMNNHLRLWCLSLSGKKEFPHRDIPTGEFKIGEKIKETLNHIPKNAANL